MWKMAWADRDTSKKADTGQLSVRFLNARSVDDDPKPCQSQRCGCSIGDREPVVFLANLVMCHMCICASAVPVHVS